MSLRLRHAIRFHLERLLLRGAGYRLLFIAVVIALVTVLGGLLAYWGSGAFAALQEAMWWAFLRLSDPGYLGDDEGLVLRSVSTLITLLGYVLFLGSLVAIMTQWLNKTILDLEKGLTPISKKNHVVLLGWTNHTPHIVRELILGGSRMRRFLRRHGSSRLSVAILSEQLSPEQRLELKHLLGKHWDEGQIIFRSGNPLKREHLDRVDVAHAASIILPGSDVGPQTPEVADARRVKTLLSLSGAFPEGRYPYMVTEMFDPSKVPVVSSLYRGRIEAVSGDEVISELLVQGIRNEGVGAVYQELCTHGRGNGLYIKSFPELEGRHFRELFALFDEAVPLGLLPGETQAGEPSLNPLGDTVLGSEDRIVFMAPGFEDIRIRQDREPSLPSPESRSLAPQQPRHRRILCLGWNDRMPLFLRELDFSRRESFQLDILSKLDPAYRQRQLERYGDPANGEVRQYTGDYINTSELMRMDPASYHSIVFLGSDWMASKEEADARTVWGQYLLRHLLGSRNPSPHILLELFDPENESLLQGSGCEIITTPVLLSHMVAHVALRPELNPIFYQLLVSGGTEIVFRRASEYGLQQGEWSFAEIQSAVGGYGDIALGLRLGERAEAELNPNRERRLDLSPRHEIVVLSTD